MTSAIIKEKDLRHPQDRIVFIASVVLNFALMATAVYVVANSPDWVKSHPVLGKQVEHIRTLALLAIFALPLATVVRNERRVVIRGNSIRLSSDQFGDVYGLLESHCKKLAMASVPELYLTNSAISEPAMAFSSYRRDYIVLSQSIVESNLETSGDAIAFILGRELGRIRLGYTRLWTEMLLSYVLRIPYLNVPITRVRTYSCDRYGAFVAPNGVRGLIVAASGRRLLQNVNIEDYIKQAAGRDDLWSRLASNLTPKPPILYRLKALYDAGLLDLDRDLRRFQEKTGSSGPDDQTARLPARPSPEPGSPAIGKKATRGRN
jgi:hypothetical protein